MEYANCDFAIATLAPGLGEKDTLKKYFKRPGNWENLWRDDYEDRNTRAFIYPRLSNGGWIQACDFVEYGYWPVRFYEGRCWNYSFYVPMMPRAPSRNAEAKIVLFKRLDTFSNEGLYDVGNEPDFLTPS